MGTARKYPEQGEGQETEQGVEERHPMLPGHCMALVNRDIQEHGL